MAPLRIALKLMRCLDIDTLHLSLTAIDGDSWAAPVSDAYLPGVTFLLSWR